ncbi:MBL fold metallo-hydrolase [Bacillus sp. CGMCC 1.16607]|uniref:MBL fold metallo-hydrolase n=1 Tax=Bacillus sp. CGMCC 1.16607 TaxID=3351842 RepID=UPI0036401917
MKIEKIKSRSFLFTYHVPAGWNLNIQLIMGNKYNYLIDTGLGSLSMEPVKEYIKHDNKPLIVINTHYHWDHIWGNCSFQESMIISHKRCKEMIELHWEEMIQKYHQYVDGEAEMVLPNLTFEKELYFPEDQIRIMYTPGHTMDTISVLDEVDKVLNVADNIGDSLDELLPSLECSKDEYRNTLLKYHKLKFDTCVSGHNIILDRQVIEKILNML